MLKINAQMLKEGISFLSSTKMYVMSYVHVFIDSPLILL